MAENKEKTVKKPEYSMKKLLARIKGRKQGEGKTVVMAFSGGVDSAVGSYLLQQQGYKVIGAFMKNWSDTKNEMTGECRWREERRTATKVAAKLNIPLTTFDFEKEYKEDVIDPMFKDYKKGRTPNPDVLCNQIIKFPKFWEKAKKIGADYMATGHFIRREPENETAKEYKLQRATCEKKDQSYFLYRLTQKEIANTLFPIGYYTKEEVRYIAEKQGLINFDKKSTTGICFVGKVDLKQFLQQKIKPKKGKIINQEGKTVGEHDGIMYYTIGQRLGSRYGLDFKKAPGKESEQRWYIAEKNAEKNEIIVAPEGHKLLYRKKMYIDEKDMHYIRKQYTGKVNARIRHVGELQPAKIKYDKKRERYELELNNKQGITGIAKGQSVVIYDPKGSEVIGGGEIEFE